MPASSPSSAGTAGSILLVEEYAALAVALGAALKRFAPKHQLRVVTSLSEAEAELSSGAPDLLVVDFDPPTTEAVELFRRIRAAHPAVGIVVVASGVPREIVGSALVLSDLQYVTKPFNLDDLRAAVEKLLPDRTDSAAPARSSQRRGFSLIETLSLLCVAAASRVVRVEKNRRRKGEIHITRGQITHAALSAMTGEDALQEMLSWPGPTVTFPEERPDGTRTIQGRWYGVLAAAATIDEPEEEQPPRAELSSPVMPPPVIATAKDGKKVVVVDDTDLLRVFVEEVLGTAIPTLNISTAPDGTAGVKQVASDQPDLVLLDYSLPDINGDEVCQQLLANDATSKIPVIMMSGHVPEMMASAARFENIVATLAKPFLSSALVKLVTATLENPPQIRPKAVAEPPPSAPQPPPVAQPSASVPQKQRRNGNGSAKIQTAPPPPPVPLGSVTGTGEPPFVPSMPLPTAPVAKATATIPAVAPPPAAVTKTAPASSTSATPVAVTGWAPARVPAAQNNNVVVGIPLEAVSMQFSPTLQIAAIRARPCSTTVLVHIDPQALPGAALPEAGFQLTRVDVDVRGQIQTMRLAPTVQQVAPLQSRNAFPIAAVAVLPSNGGRAMQLTPAAVAPMRMQLLAAFELAGVELSATFGISSLVLKSRGGKMRVSLQPEAANTGATFETAQVLLDRSARIAEILLDAVA